MFWKFLLKICSLDIFPLEYEEFSFWKWRVFFMITKRRRWRWTRNDENLFMMIFFFFLNLSFEWEQLWLKVDMDCWISSWLNSCKKIISINNGFIHWNNRKYLPNAPNLGHIPCLDWTWVHLMLQPLGNMKEDHGPRSLVPAK